VTDLEFVQIPKLTIYTARLKNVQSFKNAWTLLVIRTATTSKQIFLRLSSYSSFSLIMN